MGKIYDLKETVATALQANVPELADVDVIAHHGRDCQIAIREGLAKASGLAVVVDVIGGENENPDEKAVLDLRLRSTLSLTLWTTPIKLKFDSGGDPAPEPLTEGARQPDDVLEAILKGLNFLNLSTSQPAEGCSTTADVRVLRWGMINNEPPFLVFEIQATCITQL